MQLCFFNNTLQHTSITVLRRKLFPHWNGGDLQLGATEFHSKGIPCTCLKWSAKERRKWCAKERRKAWISCMTWRFAPNWPADHEKEVMIHQFAYLSTERRERSWSRYMSEVTVSLPVLSITCSSPADSLSSAHSSMCNLHDYPCMSSPPPLRPTLIRAMYVVLLCVTMVFPSPA